MIFTIHSSTKFLNLQKEIEKRTSRSLTKRRKKWSSFAKYSFRWMLLAIYFYIFGEFKNVKWMVEEGEIKECEGWILCLFAPLLIQFPYGLKFQHNIASVFQIIIQFDKLVPQKEREKRG